MTADVTQWLTEIKALQQQLIEARRERDEAYTSAANWRMLYETESQQRRTEAVLSQQTIAQLQAELQRLKGKSLTVESTIADSSPFQQEVAQLESLLEAKERLLSLLIEREQLSQALKTEQANHAQTRKTLTTALGDTVDLLTKERATKNNPEEPSPESSQD